MIYIRDEILEIQSHYDNITFHSILLRFLKSKEYKSWKSRINGLVDSETAKFIYGLKSSSQKNTHSKHLEKLMTVLYKSPLHIKIFSNPYLFKLLVVIENCPVATTLCSILNNSYPIIYANKHYEMLYDCDRWDILSEDCLHCHEKEDRDLLNEQLQTILSRSRKEIYGLVVTCDVKSRVPSRGVSVKNHVVMKYIFTNENKAPELLLCFHYHMDFKESVSRHESSLCDVFNPAEVTMEEAFIDTQSDKKFVNDFIIDNVPDVIKTDVKM
jgi:hypothetical protein